MRWINLTLPIRKTIVAAVALATGAALSACGSSGKPAAGSGGGGSTSVPNLTVSSFTRNFSAMTQLKPFAAKGKGNVAVILPDTTLFLVDGLPYDSGSGYYGDGYTVRGDAPRLTITEPITDHPSGWMGWLRDGVLEWE